MAPGTCAVDMLPFCVRSECRLF